MMRVQKFIFFLVLFSLFALAQAEPLFQGKISEIPPQTREQVERYSWHPGCPVPLAGLSYLELSYWGFDGRAHTGALIVNKQVAQEVMDIFRDLFDEKFPIERMETVDRFKGYDEAALAANNTFAFNCQEVIGKPGVFSLHSYGCAIDINTLVNPYVKGNEVLPPAGRPYADRSKPIPGMIIQNDATYQAFIKRGWTWGGDSIPFKEYGHFKKDCSTPVK